MLPTPTAFRVVRLTANFARIPPENGQQLTAIRGEHNFGR